MSVQDLEEFLMEEAEYSTREVERMSRTEKLNAWLEYEGIIGYTDDILEVITALVGADGHIRPENLLDTFGSLMGD